jgi:hypothetical protein
MTSVTPLFMCLFVLLADSACTTNLLWSSLRETAFYRYVSVFYTYADQRYPCNEINKNQWPCNFLLPCLFLLEFSKNVRNTEKMALQVDSLTRFFTTVFFHQDFPPAHYFISYSVFPLDFEFAQIFEFVPLATLNFYA